MVNTTPVNRTLRRSPLFVSASFCLWVFLCLFFILPSFATKIPPNLKLGIQKDFSGAKFRLDGSFETPHGELFIPIIPQKTTHNNKAEVTLQAALPSRQEPNFLVFGNAWCYVRVVSRGRFCTVRLPADITEPFRKFVLSGKFPTDLIVPEHFVLPKSLKPMVSDLPIQLIDDDVVKKPELVKPGAKTTPKAANNGGSIFVLSPTTGKITMLDGKSLEKLTEFSTEGTPSGCALAQGKIYIADQSKNRILKLDPKSRQFVGQIDLPPHSAPKGLSALPSGKLIYVSESGTNTVAVFESATDRLLVRTKVAVGPGRMAVTPNGSMVLVLNTPAGRMSFLSAQTQKLLGVLALGNMPCAIEIDSDSEKAYVSNRLSNTVSVVDLLRRTVVETLKTGNGPIGLVLNDDENKLFVSNAKDNTISVFDLREHKKLDDLKLPLDVDFPGNSLLMRDRKHILISSESTDAIGLLDASSMTFDKPPVIGHTSDEFLWVPFD
jgi:YVTN family beta-propeller protein